MQIGILFTTKNCLSFTKAAIASIQTRHPHQILIVDDNSTDDTVNWAKSQELLVLEAGHIEALAARWNAGIKMFFDMGAEAVLVCNNDIVFSPVTIDAIVDRLQKAIDLGENIGMVTAHNMRGKMSVMKIKNLKELPYEPTESDGPDFSCFLISKYAYEAVGPIPEIFVPCYFEDNAQHINMAKAGWRAIATTAAPYYHYGSITQNSVMGGMCPAEKFEHNRKLFEETYGFSTASQKYRDIIDSARKV